MDTIRDLLGWILLVGMLLLIVVMVIAFGSQQIQIDRSDCADRGGVLVNKAGGGFACVQPLK